MRRTRISLEKRTFVKKRDGYACQECGLQILPPEVFKQNPYWKNKICILEIDHVVPVTSGGHGDVDNLQILCNRCNARKFNLVKQDNIKLANDSIVEKTSKNAAELISMLIDKGITKYRIADECMVVWLTVHNWSRKTTLPSSLNMQKIITIAQKYNIC